MKLIRLCKEEEVKSILERKDFDGVGKKYQNNEKLNNFNYDPNEKYLHFFRDISGILYLDSTKGNYICTYLVPDELLEGKNGYGKYLDYVNFKQLQLVPEFAIESKFLSFDNLEKVEKIVKDIDYHDLFFNPYFKGLTETIYDAEDERDLGEN